MYRHAHGYVDATPIHATVPGHEGIRRRPLGLKLFKEELLKRNIRIVKMSTNQDALNGRFKPDMYLVNEMSTGG